MSRDREEVVILLPVEVGKLFVREAKVCHGAHHHDHYKQAVSHC